MSSLQKNRRGAEKTTMFLDDEVTQPAGDMPAGDQAAPAGDMPAGDAAADANQPAA